jgi:hypothetical protein
MASFSLFICAKGANCQLFTLFVRKVQIPSFSLLFVRKVQLAAYPLLFVRKVQTSRLSWNWGKLLLKAAKKTQRHGEFSLFLVGGQRCALGALNDALWTVFGLRGV